MEKNLEELTKQMEQLQQPQQSMDVVEYLIAGFTNSANALIDYIRCNCRSVKAFEELSSRHTELLTQMIIEYKKRLK